MAKIHPQAAQLIDQYIHEAPEFAQPICHKLRSLIHQADAGIVEDWKWGPNFNKDGMLCGFGAFQRHVALAFFKGALMKDTAGIFNQQSGNRHNRSVHFRNEKEMDADTLIEYVREAVLVNECGITVAPVPRRLTLPADLQKALSENKTAKQHFDNLAYTYRNEYVNWVEKARRGDTRERRIKEVVRRSELNQRLHEKYMR